MVVAHQISAHKLPLTLEEDDMRVLIIRDLMCNKNNNPLLNQAIFKPTSTFHVQMQLMFMSLLHK